MMDLWTSFAEAPLRFAERRLETHDASARRRTLAQTAKWTDRPISCACNRGDAMDNHTFDRLAKRLAARRFSRREAVRTGGALAAAGLGAGGIVRAAAGQDAIATPAVAPASTSLLFVQTFTGATLSEKTDEAGVYTLTLLEGGGYTLYFSDRPERLAGMVKTSAFLNDFGFTSQNPPNAAFVVETNESTTDHEDILVVELLNPMYDAATDALTYDVRFIDDYSSLDMRFSEQPQPAPTSPQTYGASSLFIDDALCGDHTVSCNTGTFECCCKEVGTIGKKAFCIGIGPTCTPCDGWDHFRTECNEKVPECLGDCFPNRKGICG